MSNGTPQVEDGYTRIANELLEALCRCPHFNERTRTLLAIIRKTYGYHKTSDMISILQIEETTGLPKRSVKRARRELELCNIITVSKSVKGGCQKVSKGGVNIDTHKRYSKDIIQKKTSKVFDDESVEMRLSKLLFDLMRQNNPDCKQPNLQTWASHIDRMLRIDKRPPKDAAEIIRWCQGDSFWYKNILSTETLRKQYDKLALAMKDPKRNQAKQQSSDGEVCLEFDL